MAAAGLGLPARKRHVDPGNFVHGKALADGVHAAEPREQLAQPGRGDPVDFEIDVLRRLSKEPIPHPTPHDERATACVPHAARNGDRDFETSPFVRSGIHSPCTETTGPAGCARPSG
jgi:hypothetical protein